MIEEHGAPGWFELFTRDFTGALDFYRTVFAWRTEIEGDTDEFRYATLRHPDDTDRQLAGVMDASGFLPDGVPEHWSIYWDVDDVDATVARVGSWAARWSTGRWTPPTAVWPRPPTRPGHSSKLRTPPG